MARAIRNPIRANRFAIETPIFIARQADSPESLESPIRANHPIRANQANRFARITPLSGGWVVFWGGFFFLDFCGLGGRRGKLW